MPARAPSSLAQLWRTDGPPWPEARVLALAADLGRSLADWHERGVLLGDGLDPVQVDIDQRGRCSFRGPAGGGAGFQQDVYRFGVLLLIALSGLPAESVEAVLARRVRPSALAGRRLTPGFEFLLGRCVSARPDRRYARGVELWHDIVALTAGRGGWEAPGISAGRPRTWRQRAAALFHAPWPSAAAGQRRPGAAAALGPPWPSAAAGQRRRGAAAALGPPWPSAAAWALALFLAGAVAFLVTYGAAGHQARLRLPQRLLAPEAPASTAGD